MNRNSIQSVLSGLHSEEIEAIDDYQKAIRKFKTAGKGKKIGVLRHILGEEKQHARELKEK